MDIYGIQWINNELFWGRWGHKLAPFKTEAASKKPELEKYIHHFRSAVYKIPKRGRVYNLLILWRNDYCGSRVINLLWNF